jgi:mono/diheme cytochrome c family protein
VIRAQGLRVSGGAASSVPKSAHLLPVAPGLQSSTGVYTSILALLLVATPTPAAKPPSESSPPTQPWDLVWMIDPPDGNPSIAAPAPTPAMQVLGDALYEARCQSCHGAKGDGRSSLAGQLHPAPTDFTRGAYKLRSTPSGSLPTDRDLFRTLTRGLHGTAMQPWRRLTEIERWALVQKLKTFSSRFRSEMPPAPVAVPRPPRETIALDDRGAVLYERLGCGSCHGETGAADGPAREVYRRDPARRKIRIRNFTRGRFIRGIEMEDIFLTLRVGIEGTPMAAYDKLDDGEVWALAAHVRSMLRELPYNDLPPARTSALEGQNAPSR